MQEVSRAHSTEKKGIRRNLALKAPFGKERIYLDKLPPQYVVGFIDGEGSFSVSIGKHKTTKSGFEVRPEFEIELRADDREILERILVTIGCGRIYDCSYDRYGWYPHAKYKISNREDMFKYLFPFLDQYPLQAKKAKVYPFFRQIVTMCRNKEHLTEKGLQRITKLRDEMRKLGRKERLVSSK